MGLGGESKEEEVSRRRRGGRRVEREREYGRERDRENDVEPGWLFVVEREISTARGGQPFLPSKFD